MGNILHDFLSGTGGGTFTGPGTLAGTTGGCLTREVGIAC